MNPPANWYPDPTSRHGQRYWDGERWTEHVFTDGVQDVDPLDTVDSTTRSSDEVAADEVATEADAADAADADEDLTTTGDEVTPTSADDGAGPAPLPMRRRATGDARADAAPTQDTDQADAPLSDADRLFAEPPGDLDAVDSADSAVPEPDDADAAVRTRSWTSEEARDDDEDAADDVAPAVEPQDVVASVDELTERAGTDFSDAFVLAPETASRLVGRSDRSADGDVPDRAADEEGDVAAAAAPDGGGAAQDTHDSTTGTPVEAPPPAGRTPVSTASTGLGISGDLLSGAFAEHEGDGPVALQNNRMLRCAASGGIVARQGTMVAYQGDVQFERQGAGGVGRALKRAATGEGLAMMRVTGAGDVFFADSGQHVFVLELDGGSGLSINGRNVLAFSASLQWDIERVKGASLLAGGLFNTTLTGTGWVALVSDGEPVVLRTDEAATHVDVNALVAWSAGLSTRVVNTVTAKSLVGLGSGEAFQMAFEGNGIAIVQPSEGPMGGATAT